MNKKLVWPLYHIRTYRSIEEKDGIIYLEDNRGTYIIDNKNLSGDTLGKRRIRLKHSYLDEGIRIYKLTKIFYYWADVINNTHLSKTYIDSKGTLFFYKKSNRRKLIYKKVKDIVITKDSKLLVYCEDIFKPILISFIPVVMPKYLGLLQIYDDYLLYELSSTDKKETWRLV